MINKIKKTSNTLNKELSCDCTKISIYFSKEEEKLKKTQNINDHLEHSIKNTGLIINVLKNKSIDIEELNNIINSISKKIYTLSLNSAIEAARIDGDSNVFSTTANEIISLVRQTQDSTIYIQKIIHELKYQSEIADNNMIESINSINRLNSHVKSSFYNISN